MYLRSSIFFSSLFILVISCNNNNENMRLDAPNEGFISLKDIFDDQWKIKKDQPYVLLKTIKYNDTVDSSFVDQDSTLFHQLAAYFTKADISNPDYVPLYNYSESYDNESGMVFLHYIAKDPNAFTQKMELTMDRYTSTLMNVYVETNHKSFFNHKSQKLLYSTEKGFFIQEYENRIFSDPKSTVLNFYYKY